MYNLYFATRMGKFNIMGVSEDKMAIPVKAYKEGRDHFTISGEKYSIKGLNSFQIFTHEQDKSPKEIFDKAIDLGLAKLNFFGSYLIDPENLELLGQNVTDQFIGDNEFGELVPQETKSYFINPERIDELNNLNSMDFDFRRLIQLCHELNDNYSRENYLSVAMIGRSIINHVPPIFGFTTFNEVTNNYGRKSFKEAMKNLNGTMRNIADSYLHDTIRKKENIPNSNQVDFSQALDLLLSEIIRIN